MPISLAYPTFNGAALSANLGAGSYGNLFFGPGTDFHVSRLNLDDLPAIRVNDSSRPLDPGTFSGFDFPEGRTFLLDITIIAKDNATFHTDLAALQAAFVPLKQTVQPLYLFNSQRLINVADGAGSAIATLTERRFTWSGVRALWYRSA